MNLRFIRAACVIGAAAVASVLGVARANAAETTPISRYEARGVLKRIDPHATQVTIAHDAIARVMPAMTMTFDVPNPPDLAKFHIGDAVTFQLCITSTTAWIERLAAVPTDRVGDFIRPAAPGEAPELDLGEEAPDIAMTDQTGAKLSLQSLRGNAVAITFIYTRCPLPNYCPLMSRNFETAQSLLRRLGASDGWRFVSLSIDPEHDTQDAMAAYSKDFQADPLRWSFALASPADLRRLGRAAGLEIDRTNGRIDHNLRVLVLDGNGRVRRIFRGNRWTPQELAAEVRSAMRPSAE